MGETSKLREENASLAEKLLQQIRTSEEDTKQLLSLQQHNVLLQKEVQELRQLLDAEHEAAAQAMAEQFRSSSQVIADLRQQLTMLKGKDAASLPDLQRPSSRSILSGALAFVLFAAFVLICW